MRHPSKVDNEKQQTTEAEPQSKEPKIEQEAGIDNGKDTSCNEEDDGDYEVYADSDSEEDVDDIRFRKYVRTMVKSQFYYIPDKPEGVKISSTRPRKVSDTNLLKRISQYALDWYNKEKVDNGHYDLVEVLYGSRFLVSTIRICSTFVARHHPTGVEETFRTRVVILPPNEHSVICCDKFDLPEDHPHCWCP